MNIKIKYILNGVELEGSAEENNAYFLDVVTDKSRTKIIIKTKQPLELKSALLTEAFSYQKDDTIFLNGYQSWTETREFEIGETVRNLNKVPKAIREKFHFAQYGDPWFLEYDKKPLHGFTYSYVKQADDNSVLWGSYNEENAYLVIRHYPDESKVVLQSDVENRAVDGEFVLFDYVRLVGKTGEINEAYFAEYEKEAKTIAAKPLRGYTSWYNDYQDISEAKMEKALAGVTKENYDLFQIDDGYETFVGDWMEMDPAKFPNGLKGLVDEIHSKGLLAGIWVAPFVCELKSRIYREHNDWVLKKNGKEVFAGCNWSGDVALDVRLPEVKAYVRESLQHFIDLGFDFFKLDFLYAAALAGGTNEHTRAEIMRESMQLLRSILKDKLILGCGVPLSSAFNLVEYCRIGPDITLDFDDKAYMRKMHLERTSTKVTLLNTIFRKPMDGHVFRCDPDVYLLRDDNIKLTDAQKEAVIMIAHLMGSLYLTSDNVSEYDDKKREVLKNAEKLVGASIENVRRLGDLIKIEYQANGVKGSLTYNIRQGVLKK